MWINQKFCSAAISGLLMTAIASVEISQHQALALPSQTVNQVAKKSAVRIDGAGNGSGVIVAKDDYGYAVLTNRHVVENSGEYQVATVDGQIHDVVDIQELEGADLALVYFDSDRQYTVVARGDSDTLTEGEAIYIAGYPGSQTVATNRTYRFMSESLIGFLAPSDVVDGYELIYSGEQVPGMSGSPIVNQEGQLIGIYGESEIDIQTGATYLYGIPLNTALKIATRAGIILDSGIANQPKPSGNMDLFTPAPNSSNAEIDLFATTPEPAIVDNESSGNAGFEIVGNAQVNNFVIPEIIYTGECPGRKLGSQEALFFSNTTTTAADRRVIITNVTRGLKRDPLPYTDREYESGASEGTKVTLGAEHEEKNFVVLTGLNQFQYEIVQVEDNDFETVLEEGTFTATAEKTQRYVERNKEPKEETYCPDDKKYCEKEEKKVRTVYRCPYS